MIKTISEWFRDVKAGETICLICGSRYTGGHDCPVPMDHHSRRSISRGDGIHFDRNSISASWGLHCDNALGTYIEHEQKKAFNYNLC